MQEETKPRVGLGVMLFKDGKVLLGKRKSAHASGEYCFPGGHLEYGETFEECCRREVREETGIEIENIRFLFLGNTKLYMPRHYVQISFLADWKSGEPRVLEPEKCESWGWYDPKKLPKPTFKMSEIATQAYLEKFNYLDGI